MISNTRTFWYSMNATKITAVATSIFVSVAGLAFGAYFSDQIGTTAIQSICTASGILLGFLINGLTTIGAPENISGKNYDIAQGLHFKITQLISDVSLTATIMALTLVVSIIRLVFNDNETHTVVEIFITSVLMGFVFLGLWRCINLPQELAEVHRMRLDDALAASEKNNRSIARKNFDD